MRHKQATWTQRATVLLLCALMVQPWGAYRLMAADITPGYTFSSGEANVTHTKLNNAASGTIATTFYSGKSSAGSSPTPGNYTMIGLDSVSGTYKRATLDAWFFDHSGLLADRTALTAPSAAYTLFVNDGGAYKQISITNLFFGGTSFTVPTNQTRFGGVVQDGGFGSITYSNLIGSLVAHTLPTNGDFFPLITENGRGVKGMTLESLFKSQTAGTNFNGDHLIVSWDGTRLRGNRATNLIDGVTTTNTAPKTNAALVVLEDGVLKKLFLNELRQMSSVRNVGWAVNTNGADLTPNGSWIDVTSLSVSLTPRATNSKVLVTATLNVDVDAVPAHFKLVRGSTDIGVGVASGSRTQAGTSIDNASTLSVMLQWLDTPATTGATTYKVQCFQVSGGGNHIYLNRSSADTDSASHPRSVSTLLVEEIIQ